MVVLPPAWSRGRSHAFSFSGAIAPHTRAVSASQRRAVVCASEPKHKSSRSGAVAAAQAVVAIAALSGVTAGQFGADPIGHAWPAPTRRGLVHLLQAASGGRQRR